jgi:hypothetical protein
LSKFRGCNEAYFNGGKISIRQARRGRPKGTYLCPDCRNPVFPANLSSTLHAPCFKHFEEPEECERYFGGIFVDEVDSPHAALVLRLVLEVDESQAQSWRLFLQLPPPSYAGRGIVHVYSGPSLGLVEVPLTRIDLGAGDVAIAPSFQAYRVDWVRGNDAQEYLEAFDPRKQSVALHNPATAFDVTQSGRSGRVDGQLYWSRSYYLVHSADLPIPTPLRPEPVSQRYDRRYEEWRCARVVLPTAPNESLARWLQANVGLAVKEPAVKATVLYPFTMGLYQATERTTRVDTTTSTLVAIEHPAKPSVKMQCVVEQGAHMMAEPLSTDPISFVSVSASPAMDVPLCIGADEDPSSPWYPLATLTPAARSRSSAVVHFDFEGREGVAAHEPALFGLFSQARRNRSAIVAIRNPLGVSIIVESRAFPGAQWRRHPFTCDAAGISLLNECVQDADVDLRIIISGMSALALISTAQTSPAELIGAGKNDPLLAQYGRFAHASTRRGKSRLADRESTFDHNALGLRTRALSRHGGSAK